jgi:hypothetical protein
MTILPPDRLFLPNPRTERETKLQTNFSEVTLRRQMITSRLIVDCLRASNGGRWNWNNSFCERNKLPLSNFYSLLRQTDCQIVARKKFEAIRCRTVGHKEGQLLEKQHNFWTVDANLQSDTTHHISLLRVKRAIYSVQRTINEMQKRGWC